MIINSSLQKFIEKDHPLKKLEHGEIKGSFFKRKENGELPNGLYFTDVDFSVGDWFFDSDTKQPARTVTITEEIVTQNQGLAKQTRDNEVSANITAHDAEWQVVNDAEDIRKVIDDAETIGASEDDKTMFRLADNSWRETTLSELRDVLKAHIARKQDVWNKMAAWDSGDKQTEFVVE